MDPHAARQMMRYRYVTLVASAILVAGCRAMLMPSPAQPSSADLSSPSPLSSHAPVETAPPPTADALQAPAPADIAVATALVDRYIDDLVHGRYAAAWELLDPWSRKFYGSLARYRVDERGLFESIAGRYTVTPNPLGLGRLSDWLPAVGGPDVDLNGAVLVEVDYPKIAFANQWDAYLVAKDGPTLRLFEVR